MKPLLKVRPRTWEPRDGKNFHPPRQSSWLPGLIDLVGGLYSRFGLGLRTLVFRGEDVLARMLEEDQRTGTRSILAFRHCGDADPQAVFRALNSLLRRSYKKAGLKSRPRFLVLASAEIALWGGPLAEFILAKAGTLPLSHGALGRRALDWLRAYLAGDQDRILVLAPEGQITYEMEAPVILDSGIASMVQWSGIRRTRVLPLGIKYHCHGETWKRWDIFMSRLEADCGMPAPEKEPRKRLLNLWDHLLTKGEDYYRKIHRKDLPEIAGSAQELSVLSLRCRRLAGTAAEMACRIRGLEPSGDPRADNFRIRSANLEILLGGTGQSSLERNLRRRSCREAYWTNRHQELSDLLVNLDPDRLPPELGLAQGVEAALNLADFAGRLAGGTVADRPRYFRRDLEISLGEPRSFPEDGAEISGAAGRKDRIRMFLSGLAGEFRRLGRW